MHTDRVGARIHAMGARSPAALRASTLSQEERGQIDGLHGTTQSTEHPIPPLAEAAVPCLTILCHPDPTRVGEGAPLTGLLSGRNQPLSRLEPRFHQRDGGGPRPLADHHLSRKPFSLAPGKDGGVVLDPTTTRTSLLADGRPLQTRRELSPDELARGTVLLLANRVALLLHTSEPSSPPPSDHGMIGESAGIEKVRREIQRVAGLPFPVLVQGESGTGKELVARALHDASPRHNKAYVAVNVGAIPPALAAAELFGAARGSFTGADRQRLGYFQQAIGGTLFLDEIGEATQELQVMLLRVLESGQIQPVGAEKPLAVDVRIVSATDVDLEAATADGRFRSPLLHRLSAYEISLPPLRSRREDFGRLFFHFLRQELQVLGAEQVLVRPDRKARPWVPAALVSRLALHNWPGNVRQLQNIVRRLAVNSHGGPELRPDCMVERLLEMTQSKKEETHRAIVPIVPSKASYREPDEVGETELISALRAHQWNVKAAAQQLNLSRASLYALIDACPGLRKAADLSREEIEECAARCAGKLKAMVEELEVSKRGLQMRMKELGI